MPGKRARDTRQRLLSAAREEFGASGIEGATTRAIAERAGCNEVTLFRHFESKLKLLAAVVQDTSEEFSELCQSPGERGGGLTGNLLRYAEVYNASMERCEGMCRALIGEGHRHPELTKELIHDVLAPFHDSLARYLDKQITEGAVKRGTDTAQIAELFTAALAGGVLRRGGGLSALDRRQWVEGVVEVFAAGIAA